jgi:hypothetical protein
LCCLGSSADINETFHIKHNLITDQLLDEISILPSHIFPNANNTGINASSSDINRKHSSRSSRRSLQINTVNYSANNPPIGVKNNKKVNKI